MTERAYEPDPNADYRAAVEAWAEMHDQEARGIPWTGPDPLARWAEQEPEAGS